MGEARFVSAAVTGNRLQDGRGVLETTEAKGEGEEGGGEGSGGTRQRYVALSGNVRVISVFMLIRKRSLHTRT